ncbi:LHFPL tetraspan subfamily member 4 protein-like isoform X4 [Chiloscyllium punctatum]|uniref:LHFPL tetraspan subfamily member 4 protein-like isoform X4 n=1 Tax=Chiloscyllium punctatum TaxID=137246 RepID=UPI003B6408DB
MLTVQDVAPLYQTDFVRNARAVAALWAVCTLCLALVEVVVLTEPGWVQAPGSGLAPPRLLRPLPAVPADRGAAPVPGLSGRPRPGALLPDPGWIRGRRPGPGPGQHLPRPGPSPLLQPGHRLQASCQTLGCVTFPDSWEAPEVRALCGSRAGSYALGSCSVHWAFGLAVLGALDALVLSVLAFILANRQESLVPETRGKKVTDSAM